MFGVPWYEVKKPGCLFTMQETWSQPKSVPGVFQKCCDDYGEMSEMWMFVFDLVFGSDDFGVKDRKT